MTESSGKHTEKFISASLNPRDQTVESLHALVDYMVARGGCRNCGRGTILRIDFASDPPPELNGVTSFTQQGIDG